MKKIMKSIIGRSKSFDNDTKNTRYWQLQGLNRKPSGWCTDDNCLCLVVYQKEKGIFM